MAVRRRCGSRWRRTSSSVRRLRGVSIFSRLNQPPRARRYTKENRRSKLLLYVRTASRDLPTHISYHDIIRGKLRPARRRILQSITRSGQVLEPGITNRCLETLVGEPDRDTFI